MTAGVAEDLHHHVRRAIGDRALRTERRRARDEHVQAHDACHALEPVACRRDDLRDDTERRQPRGLSAFGVADIVAETPEICRLSVVARNLTRNVKQIAFLHEWHVIGSGCGRGFKRQAEAGGAGGNRGGHRKGTVLVTEKLRCY
ncbi:hypothetical protein QF001_002316 [Paraburkholderia youngii]